MPTTLPPARRPALPTRSRAFRRRLVGPVLALAWSLGVWSGGCEGESAGPAVGAACIARESADGVGAAVAMYRGTAEHTGVAAAGERLRVPPQRLWTVGPINVGIHSASKSSPVADATQLYIGADDERLYAFDKRTGEHRWTWYSRPCKNGIHATPAVDDVRVYIGDYAGWLSAIDKRSGALAWETRLGDSIGASPVVVGDRIYVGVETRVPDGYLVAVDRQTGEEVLRTAPFGDHTHATPSFDGSGDGPACTAFLGSNRGLFHAFDAATGEERWRFAPRGALEPWPALAERPAFHAQIKSTAAVVDGRVLFTSWDWRLYCLDAATGAEAWSYETGARSMSSPTVDVASGRVFFGSHDQRVHAVDLRTGAPLWTFETGDRVYSSGVLVDRKDGAGQVFVIGSSDGHVYALDTDTGAVAWDARLGGPLTSVPLVDGGRLYLSTDGGDLSCWE